MDYTISIVNLYSVVFENQRIKIGVKAHDIVQGFAEMKEAYMPNPDWEMDQDNKVVNYNTPAYRCAYLHKYAMLHTGLLCSVLQTAFRKGNINKNINSKKKLNLCSLGGGPGSDIVSLLFVIKEIFGFIQCNVNVVDLDLEWKYVFEAIVSELRTGKYGAVKDMVSTWYFSYQYLSADLLAVSYYNKYKVYSAVTTADIISMVKFVSAAAAGRKTRLMIRKVFEIMKAGAMLLFVDNAAGGFQELVKEEALQNGMRSIFGPLQHYEFEEPRFSRKQYGYTSQSKTKVVIEIWQKPDSGLYITTQNLQRQYMYRGESSGIIQSSDPIRGENITLGRRQAQEEDAGCCSII